MTSSPPPVPPELSPGRAFALDRGLVDLLRGKLPEVAEHTIAAVMDEVPAYDDAFGGPMGGTIEQAVQMALAGFLRLASQGRTIDPGTPLSPALEGAYALGRGEARSGRSADALLSAYRVGARVAWRELAATAVANDVPADTVAAFAELVFAYIDELSAASVAGHADELETSGRVRQRYLDRLAAGLLRGDAADELAGAAARADWRPPKTLTAVLLPEAQVRPVLGLVDAARTLQVGEDAPGLPSGLSVLLVPDLGGRSRARLMRILDGRAAVAGPSRAWLEVRTSYRRALRALHLRTGQASLDTEEHLPTLVLGADPEALADLRAQALAPLAGLKPAAADKLSSTLRAWLLHQGRRDEAAGALFVHPQTVRYRMGQLRELYGDRLDDPEMVLALTLALGAPPEDGAERVKEESG
ncbi:helix-turn-helix domain-containing protein [Nocardioides bigeumensis]|uniref:Helix-turn-helix domain-containing protein n=1 Tax=Nocardioides bigeumensis TaxID=433657 RepID=A0ABN2YX33_9ACTN